MKNFKEVDGKIVCICGHPIGIVGTKWQHISTEIEHRRYRETCYFCGCIDPVPADEDELSKEELAELNATIADTGSAPRFY